MEQALLAFGELSAPTTEYRTKVGMIIQEGKLGFQRL